MTSFSIIKPDDMHVHFRDGEIMQIVANQTAKQFSRAVVMPNLVPPVTTTKLATEYKSRIDEAVKGANFSPLMTLYLTDSTQPDEIIKAKESGFIVGAKLYPAGATTNSDSGVTDIKNIYPALEQMEKSGLLLLVHGEVVDSDIDIFEREEIFIRRILKKVVQDFPNLKIVFEHITTFQAVEFVTNASDNIAATITPQHLLFNRNDMLAGGIKPHYYCLPILKREEHRQALVEAAFSGSPKFFAGTDSAPHLKHQKESDCGCAGCYTGCNAVELYAQVFDELDLSKSDTHILFENFMSKFGAEFYGLEYNTDKLTLTKNTYSITQKIETPEGDITPLMAGQNLDWSVDA